MGRPAHAGNRSGLGREGDLVEEGFARARGLAKEIRPLMSVKLAAELGGLLRQASQGLSFLMSLQRAVNRRGVDVDVPRFRRTGRGSNRSQQDKVSNDDLRGGQSGLLPVLLLYIVYIYGRAHFPIGLSTGTTHQSSLWY